MERVNIEAERGRLQMTKRQFCKEIGISPPTYLNYINGKTDIPSDVLEKIRDLTGKSIDYLLGLSNG